MSSLPRRILQLSFPSLSTKKTRRKKNLFKKVQQFQDASVRILTKINTQMTDFSLMHNVSQNSAVHTSPVSCRIFTQMYKQIIPFLLCLLHQQLTVEVNR